MTYMTYDIINPTSKLRQRLLNFPQQFRMSDVSVVVTLSFNAKVDLARKQAPRR